MATLVTRRSSPSPGRNNIYRRVLTPAEPVMPNTDAHGQSRDAENEKNSPSPVHTNDDVMRVLSVACQCRYAKNNGVDKTIRKYTNPDDFEELKAEEYRYWQRRPVHERVAAVSELTQE